MTPTPKTMRPFGSQARPMLNVLLAVAALVLAATPVAAQSTNTDGALLVHPTTNRSGGASQSNTDGAVVALAGRMVLIEVLRIHAGVEQGITLQVEHLAPIRLAHTHVADQHGRALTGSPGR